MHIARGESAWPDNYPGLLLAQTTKAAMAVDKAHSIYILLEAFSLSLAFMFTLSLAIQVPVTFR